VTTIAASSKARIAARSDAADVHAQHSDRHRPQVFYQSDIREHRLDFTHGRTWRVALAMKMGDDLRNDQGDIRAQSPCHAFYRICTEISLALQRSSTASSLH
jgi:hypothetical protein